MATQVWPAFMNFPQAIRLAASFRSAVSSMMQGDLPPSSNDTGIRFLPATSITCLPTAGLPVKKM